MTAGTGVESVREDETGLEATDKHFRLIVANSEGGRDAVESLFATVQEEDVPEDEPARDVISIMLGDDSDGEFATVRELPSDRLFIAVSKPDLDAGKVVDLLIGVTKSSVTPYATRGSRAQWKADRRPTAIVASEWTPEDGAFDVPISKRADALVSGANKRMSSAFEAAFSSKLENGARAAVARWSKKVGCVAPDPERSAKRSKTKKSEGDKTAEDVDAAAGGGESSTMEG